MPIQLVVGLGNPGPKYADTRHNVGFMLVDGLAAGEGYRPWKVPGLGEHAKASFSDAVHLVKPLTFMNLSGRMVQSFAHFYKIPPADVLVCYDDSDLPLGKLRIRLKGSSGGHRGMESVLEMLGTQEVPRLRIGIRAAGTRAEAMDIVLKAFGKEERKTIDKVLEDARAAVELASSKGVEAAMNKYNSSGDDPA
ncbi:MAG: aminoacyl-tRNA hydrolase [Elusimicrobia bacterium]|nr:aminoacyl-tRNA hydrolase [Elusimicrobiota bacterium]